MNKIIILLILAAIVVLICYIAYEGFVDSQEDKLTLKTKEIYRGMRAEQVIKVLGEPNYRGLIESSKMPKGWDSSWQKDYDNMRAKYDKLLFYNYHIERYQFIFFRKIPGLVQIDVCFDPAEERVVYVSRFLAME